MDLRLPILLFISIYLLYKLITRRFSLVDALAFLLPFRVFMFEIGLQFQVFYIPMSIILLNLIFQNNLKFLKINKQLLLFAFYAVITTVIISNLFINQWNNNLLYDTFFRTNGRYITSLIKLVFFQLGIFIVLININFNELTIFKALRIFFNGIVIVAMLGLLQLVVYLIFKIDIFPYTYDIDGNPVTAYSNILSSTLNLPRLTSLAGEPKGFAALLSIGLLIIEISRKHFIGFIKRPITLKYLFIVLLFLTLSTGGYGLFLILYFSLFILRAIRKDYAFKIKYHNIIILLIVSVGVMIFWKPIANAINIRVIDRASQLSKEDVDEGIQNFLFENPEWAIFGSGSGNIHNLAYNYISSNYLRKIMYGQIFISRYGYMKFISENGIIGLLLFLLFIRTVINNMGNQNKQLSGFWYLAIILSLFFLVRAGYVDREFYFIMGLAYSYKRLNKAQQYNILLRHN